ARVLGGHARSVVVPRGTGPRAVLGRVLHTAWPMHLQGAVVVGDGREVQVLHRRTWWVRGGRPVHSLARTIVPCAGVRAVGVHDHPVYADVRVVRIELDGTVLELPVRAGTSTEPALVGALGARWARLSP
ncbi:MAG: hypothetical protein HGA44_11370, partial [Cellulomonadaceae bacterium]|nr:hypothetical protein [Cellulomonadaceae bacterium]